MQPAPVRDTAPRAGYQGAPEAAMTPPRVGLPWIVLGTCLCAALLTPAWAEEPPVAPAQPSAEEVAAALVARLRDADADVRVQAALEAVACPSPALLKPLLRLLTDPEQGVREAATKALGARVEEGDRKKAAAGLVPRLARLGRPQEDQAERLVVIDALAHLAQPVSIRPLLDGIGLETLPEEFEARLDAVARVPHAEAIERLIQFLARGHRGSFGRQVAAARNALQLATGVRLGDDPDRWRAWWRDNERTFSFEAIAAARAQAEAERQEREARRAEQREKRAKKDEERRDGQPRDPD